jgi:hypothetical protein
MGYYSIIKKSELSSQKRTEQNPKSILLNERRQSDRTIDA